MQIDVANDRAQINYSANFDPGSVNRMVLSAVEKMPADKRPSLEEMAELVIDRSDNAKCVLSIKDGWIRAMDFSSRIDVAGEFKFERYRIAVQ